MNDGTANNLLKKGLISAFVPTGLVAFQSVDCLR